MENRIGNFNRKSDENTHNIKQSGVPAVISKNENDVSETNESPLLNPDIRVLNQKSIRDSFGNIKEIFALKDKKQMFEVTSNLYYYLFDCADTISEYLEGYDLNFDWSSGKSINKNDVKESLSNSKYILDCVNQLKIDIEDIKNINTNEIPAMFGLAINSALETFIPDKLRFINSWLNPNLRIDFKSLENEDDKYKDDFQQTDHLFFRNFKVGSDVYITTIDNIIYCSPDSLESFKLFKLLDKLDEFELKLKIKNEDLLTEEEFYSVRSFDYSIDDDEFEDDLEIDDLEKEISKLKKEIQDNAEKNLTSIDKYLNTNTNKLETSTKITYLINSESFLENALGLKMDLISLKELFYIGTFLENKNISEVNKIKSSISNYKNEEKALFWKTFLALEHGDESIGIFINEIAEKLPKEVANKIFSKYAEIVDISENTQSILEEILPKNIVQNSKGEFNDIKESMLIRAKNLLVTFHQNKDGGEIELLKSLERYKAGMLLYADCFKKLKQSGKEIKLESIKKTELNVLSQEEKEEIANELWDITIANRPFINEKEEIENRKKEFFSSIENVDSDFYVLKYEGSIMAFCSITPDENGDLYLESVNTESEVKGTMIGSDFLPSVLEKIKSLGKDIYGHVNTKNPMALPYYERMGFEIKKIEENGVLKYYEIRIPTHKIIKESV